MNSHAPAAHPYRCSALGLAACAALAALFLAAAPATAAKSAAEIVDAMVEAHGGMEPWASAPTVSWKDEFIMAGTEQGAVADVTVEQGPRRVYIDLTLPTGEAMSMSWDGEKAWSRNWNFPLPPRFLAQLNYYFLNLPWVSKDPGVHLGEPGTTRLWDDPTEYVTIKLTYGEGVGDTPDDYYVLYIHPETHRLHGCEYIVTYRGILPEGVPATPPHILIFDEFKEVNGLLVPTHYTIYNEDHSLFAKSKAWDWSFTKPFDESRMTMAEGAVVDGSMP